MSRELTVRLPWWNRHRPYFALHVVRWGDQLFNGRRRAIYHVGIMGGRLFTDRGWSRWFDIHGRWVR